MVRPDILCKSTPTYRESEWNDQDAHIRQIYVIDLSVYGRGREIFGCWANLSDTKQSLLGTNESVLKNFTFAKEALHVFKLVNIRSWTLISSTLNDIDVKAYWKVIVWPSDSSDMKISIKRSSFARNFSAMNGAYRILIKDLTRILLLLHVVFLKCSSRS